MKRTPLKRKNGLRQRTRKCGAAACGRRFSIPGDQPNKRYCSPRCYQLGRKDPERLSGVEMECARTGCASRFYRSPSLGQRYCSPACAYADRTKRPVEERLARSQRTRGTRLGVANPNFRHGKKAGKHLRGWNPKAKGETCCRVCGSGDRLNLHHAVPRAICPPAAKRDLRNGITLCASCHTRWHRGTLIFTRAVFTVEEWAYIAALELTGRDITGWLDKHYPIAQEEALTG